MDAIWSRGKNDTLDPLSVIIKLYICSYKSAGTKISVSNNRLTIQESGPFQGLVRGINGDKKNDVPILTMPILYACFNYLQVNMDKYKNLFEHAIKSLEKIKTTYQGNEIVYNVDTLKNYIATFMEVETEVEIDDNNKTHKKKRERKKEESETTESASISKIYNDDGSKLKRNVYDIISTVWTERRLQIVFDLIDEIQDISTSPNNRFTLLNTLNSYMDFIDGVTHDKILGLA